MRCVKIGVGVDFFQQRARLGVRLPVGGGFRIFRRTDIAPPETGNGRRGELKPEALFDFMGNRELADAAAKTLFDKGADARMAGVQPINAGSGPVKAVGPFAAK